MHVSSLTIGFILFNIVIAIAIPAGLCIFCRVRWKCDLLPFFAGCGVMLAFAFGLEQCAHGIVLGLKAGSVIRGNIWLYALYGGIMAGLFEETGRLLAMKFLLRKKRGNDYNALMYGAGHGGIEAFVLLFFGMLNNLIYSLMINAGKSELLLQAVDGANAAALQSVFDTLTQASPFLFLAGAVERLAAVTAHMALSVLVWIAVSRKGQIGLYFLAVLLHFALDAAAVLLSSTGMSMALLELMIVLIAALYVVLAAVLWKKNGCQAGGVRGQS